MLISAELRGCVTWLIHFLDLLWVKYNCAKFHHCSICVTDFRPFCPHSPTPICVQPQKCSSWIVLNMSSFRINTYLETLSAEGIQSFSYLDFNTENRIETKTFYTDCSTYRRLTKEQKKFAILIKENKKRIRILPVNGSRFFAWTYVLKI